MSRSDPSRCPAWCECTPCQRQSSRALDRMHAYLHTRTHLRAQNARTDTTHLLVVTVITLIDFGLYLRRQHARPRPHRRRQPHRGHPAASPTPVHGKIADGLQQVLKTVLLAVAFVDDRPSRRNLACRRPVPLPCPCPCPHQLARRTAVPSCLPEATDAASSCCYLHAGISATGGPQRTGVYVQFKIQALPHFPLQVLTNGFIGKPSRECSSLGWGGV